MAPIHMATFSAVRATTTISGRRRATLRGSSTHHPVVATSATAAIDTTIDELLAILRNDSVAGYLRNLPFIWARDLGTVALLLLTSPTVLGRLWRARGLFREAVRLGRLDAVRFAAHLQQGRTG